jgi:hypothetical protein
MANLFSVTAPLMIRLPTGEQHVMVERFPHPNGLVYFEPFWHLGDARQTVHRVEGPVTGDGPWKIGKCVVQVLGCHGTDHCLATDFESWRQYLIENPDEYPPRQLVEAIARRLGAITPAPPASTRARR